MAVNPVTAAAMALRLRRRRGIVAVIAIIVSIALHVIVALYLPAAWIYGDTTDKPAPPDDKPIVKVDLQPEEWRRTVDMEYLRVTSRETVADGVEPLEMERDRIDPAVFEPDLSLEILIGDDLLADDTLLETPSVVNIGPGQEIIEITDRIVTEPETSFRRAISPDVKRVSDAPDIVVPGTVDEFRHLAAAAGAQRARLPGPGDLPDVDPDVWRPVIDGTDGAGWPTLSEAAGNITDRAISDVFGEPAGDVTHVKPVERYLSLRAEKYVPSRDRDNVFFAIAIGRHEGRTATDKPFLDVLPKDVFYIQDLSGSMGNERVHRSAIGIQRAMKHLSEEDRFNIVTFAHEPGQYADTWVPATAANIARAQPFLQDMRSDGTTDIDAALNHILTMERSEIRPTIAVMLTDGIPTAGVTNSTRIIENYTRNNRGAISTYAVAAATDAVANMYLLDMLTYRNRGDALVLESDREEIAGLTEEISRRFFRPVLTDLRYYFTRDSESEVYPVMLSNLYLDDPLLLYGRVPRNQDRLAFQVVGRSGDVLYDFVFELPLDEIPEGDRDIMNQWARHRVYYLIGEHMRTEDNRILRELFNTANRYNLDIPYLEDFSAPSRFWRR